MLRHTIARVQKEAGAQAVAAAFHDYQSQTSWSYHGERWFHAASTIKVAVLAALFGAIEQGRFTLNNRLHVRNRFLSTVDGEPFRVVSSREADAAVHDRIGKMMKLQELASHMITTSSNLATNLLLDLVGTDAARASLQQMGVEGVELRRGVEDERAYEAGINNRITALGLIRLFRIIQDGDRFSPASTQAMLEMLSRQAFRQGLPAGLPEDVRERAQIAHKTGEISTVAHDAGLVFLPDRPPYAVAVLTEWEANDSSERKATVARIAEAIYQYLITYDAAHDDG